MSTPANPPMPTERMEWWREARFGMFIHWGLYSIPAGKWGNRTGHGEWIRDTAQIPVKEYDKFLTQFNPTKFDADAWCRMAKQAGMKYIVITSKHHDGFALWDSKVSDFDVMATPFKRDILDELAQACRRHGLKMCFYHSIMDWHHPDYLPRRPWEVKDRPVGDADFNKYLKYLRAQVKEILTRYGDIGIVWFDGEWESTWNHKHGQALYDLCRELQPYVIVNDRVDVGRQGHSGVIAEGYAGDYGTPEQNIPSVAPGVDWETCMTMNGHWGYNAVDVNYKTTTDLIQKLADIASKGGNFLLNVGPKADGTFPQQSIDRLREIGDWMKVNGESIYGTEMSPFDNLPWGRCTLKRNGENTTLYLHVFDWPKSGRLQLNGFASLVNSVKILGRTGGIRATRISDGLEFEVGSTPANAHDTVIKVELSGEPVVFKAPKVEAWSSQFVDRLEVNLTPGNPGLMVRYTKDGSAPTERSAVAVGPIQLTESTTLTVATFYSGRRVTKPESHRFEKVAPWAASSKPANTGLKVSSLTGDWEKVPSFASAKSEPSTNQISLGKFAEKENVALQFEGLIKVPRTAVYKFALTSDDGSTLEIDGKMVVDNDGLHGAVTKEGFAPLAEGWHRIRLCWFNKTGGAALDLKMAGPGEALAPIPANRLGS